MSDIETISAYAAIIGAASSLLLFIVAFWQLWHLRKTRSIELALSLEKEITKTERYLLDIRLEYTSLEGNPHSKSSKKSLIEKFIHSEKIYFDLIDKLCFCILKKYIAGKALKEEYEPIIRGIFESLKAKERHQDHKNICEYAKGLGYAL